MLKENGEITRQKFTKLNLGTNAKCFTFANMSNKRQLKTNEPDIDYSNPVYYTNYFSALGEVVRLRKYVHKKIQKEMSEYCGVGMNTIIRFEGANAVDDPYVNFELLLKYFLYFGLDLNLYVEPTSKGYVKKQYGRERQVV